MTDHATLRTIGGRAVKVMDAAGPDYGEPGIVWHCSGCGERSDWPLNTAVVDAVRLVTAAAGTHAVLCRI